MKKIFFLILTAAIIACNQEPKNFAAFSGKITDKNSDSLLIRNRTYSKTIKVNEDGSFSDTLNIESGIYNLFDGNESTYLFLKNGFDLNLTLNTAEFDETIIYSGNGAETSNFLAKKSLLQERLFTPALFELKEDAFKTKINDISTELTTLLESYKNLDSLVLSNEKLTLEKLSESLLSAYKQQQAQKNKFADFAGKPSPEFKDFENYKGGTTSLSDLKGKYVYVDVWATWCGPCKKEIPALKTIESKYHDKNIEFVSISVDDGRGFKAATKELAFAASKAGWKKMIADKDMGGIQLFATNAWQSEFIRGYQINGIPRFILIDPVGNIVDANAPRPSSPKLLELLDGLKI